MVTKDLERYRKRKVTQCSRCDSTGELPDDVVRYEEHEESEYEASQKFLKEGYNENTSNNRSISYDFMHKI